MCTVHFLPADLIKPHSLQNPVLNSCVLFLKPVNVTNLQKKEEFNLVIEFLVKGEIGFSAFTLGTGFFPKGFNQIKHVLSHKTAN